MQNFEKGQKVIIKLNISTLRSYELSCIIKRVESDRLALTFPEHKKDLIRYMREGKELECIIYTDKGLYVFNSIVIDSPFKADFVIELPEETKKIQHRAYERASIKLGLKLIRNKKIVKTSTVNVGGGGIRFRVNEFFENNHIWNFILTLPEGLTLVGYGEVIYSLNDQGQNVSVIKFIDISDSDRNRIIKLTYDEEIKNLQAPKAHSQRP